MYPLHLHLKVRAVLDFALFSKLIRLEYALYALPVRRVGNLRSDFLQIPPRDGHPCHSLTVPTAKPVTDFHRQVIAHAGRTNKKRGR